MKYSSTDKYRLPLALDVVAWFFDTPGIDFRCIVKEGSKHDARYYNSRWRGLSPDTLAYNMSSARVFGF